MKLATGSSGRPYSLRFELVVAFAFAVSICALRLLAFDYDMIFRLQGVVNHDSLSAASMFASSMHSLRLSGDIAWWLPAADGGYAQYYNFFLSPLAPTAGNPPFLVWSEAYRVLTWLGVAAPEYMQFLWFNAVFMPILAYATLILLCRRFCRGWIAPALACVTYAYGGPGLWNNSWMFYQDWTNIFLFLWALDLFCRRPGTTHFALVAVALIFLAASTNYWTIFSFWFVAGWVALHGYFYHAFWARALAWLWAGRRRPAIGAVVLASLLVCLLWVSILGTVLIEEAPVHTRRDFPLGNNYSQFEVYSRTDANGVRGWTSELFNPVVERPIQNYKAQNEIHNARYIGLWLLPLLLIFFTGAAFRRFDKFILSIVVLLFSICLTSGLFMIMRGAPGFAVIVHIFYFYQYFLQVVLIMIGARMLDQIIWGRRGRWPNVPAVCAAMGGLGLSGIVYIFVTSEQYQAFDVKLKSIGYASVLLAVSAMLIWRISLASYRRLATPFVLLFSLFVTGDMLHYYMRGSIADQAFTQSPAMRNLPPVLPAEIQSALAAPWRVTDPSRYDGDLFANLPVKNSLWPINEFNVSNYERAFRALPGAEAAAMALGAFGRMAAPLAAGGQEGRYDYAEAPPATLSGWSYNDVNLDVTSSLPGLYITAVAYDAGWQVFVDGNAVPIQRANVRLLAFDLPAGNHKIRMTFNPASRQLYPWAKYSTLLVLAGLMLLILVGKRWWVPAPRRNEPVRVVMA